jgi:hypothetical protein
MKILITEKQFGNISQHILIEASNPLPYELKKTSDGYVAYFTIENEEGEIIDRMKVDLDYIKNISENSPCLDGLSGLEISFRTAKYENLWTVNVTNLNKPFLIMATVMKIISDVLEKEPNVVELRYEAMGDKFDKKDRFYKYYIEKHINSNNNELYVQKDIINKFLPFKTKDYSGLMRSDIIDCLQNNN